MYMITGYIALNDLDNLLVYTCTCVSLIMSSHDSKVIYMLACSYYIFVLTFCFRTLTDIKEETKKEPEVPKTEDGDPKQ